MMPYRILCNVVKREGVKVSPDLASGLSSYLPLHKIYIVCDNDQTLWIRIKVAVL